MKKFKELRELTGRKPQGQIVYDKKHGRIPVKIMKDRNEFIVWIDGDRLESYKNQREAEKMAKEFVKQYKGKR